MDYPRLVIEREAHAQLADSQPPFGAALQLADVAGAWVQDEAVQRLDNAAGIGWVEAAEVASGA